MTEKPPAGGLDELAKVRRTIEDGLAENYIDILNYLARG
jgi:hypothetical protein